MFLETLQNSQENTFVGLSLLTKPARNQRLWHRCFPVNFTKLLRTPFLQNTSGRLFLSKTWLALQFSIFLVSSFIEDLLFITFQQKNEIKEENTLMEFKYLLFYRVSICLPSKISKEILQMVIWLENVF